MTTSPTDPRPQLRQAVHGLPDPGERVPGVAWPTVALFLGTLGLFAVEMYGVLVGDWTAWVTVPMGAAVTFLMFSVLHESTHHAASTDSRLNNALGHLSVPFVVAWATYPLVKFIHIEHHRHTNESKSIDPDAWCDEGPRLLLPLRWATIDLWYLTFYLRRVTERPRAEVAGAVAAFVIAGAAFAGLVAAGHGHALLWGYLIPQRIGILVLAWWFDYLPHHGLGTTQREDKYRATRIRVGGEKVLTPLFVYQNYHLVHHLHPSVPFYRYVRAWRRNEQAYLDRNAAISTWFGRSLTTTEYRTWRRLTDQFAGGAGDLPPGRRPVFHPLRVSAIEQLTDDAVTVTFDVPHDLVEAYAHLPGQHVTLRAVVDGTEVRRSYSLVDAPSTGRLRVAVKLVDGGAFSSYVHRDLGVDDILDVMTPTGSFHVPLAPAAQRHFAAVVAGSGITPVMSLAATTLEAEPQSRFTLVYGSRTAESTMFRAELEQLRARHGDRLTVHHVLSRAASGASPARITPELVHVLTADHGPVDAWFLCGPEALVDDVHAALRAREQRVLTEVFHREPVDATPAAVADLDSQVTVVVDGRETSFDLRSTGQTILDAALEAGVDAPYSCAGGACGTCRAKVVLGRAVMDQNHVLDDDQIAAGYVLTCQAHPSTEQLRADYDA